jgi:hypothetical protein
MGRGGLLTFIQELLSVRTVDEERSLPPLISFFPEIDGIPDDNPVTLLS